MKQSEILAVLAKHEAVPDHSGEIRFCGEECPEGWEATGYEIDGWKQWSEHVAPLLASDK